MCNPALDYLLSFVRLVQARFYLWWELCIADVGATDSVVTEILTEAVLRDRRNKVVQRRRNGPVSAASNPALPLAKRGFIRFRFEGRRVC
jgi:hypothetical protein